MVDESRSCDGAPAQVCIQTRSGGADAEISARLAAAWACAAILIPLTGLLAVGAFVRTPSPEAVVRSALSDAGAFTTGDAWLRLGSAHSQHWLFITDDDGCWLQQNRRRRRRGLVWRGSRISPRPISGTIIRYGRNYRRKFNVSCFAGAPRAPPATSGDPHRSPQPARRFSADRQVPQSNPFPDESTGTATPRCARQIPRQIVQTQGPFRLFGQSRARIHPSCADSKAIFSPNKARKPQVRTQGELRAQQFFGDHGGLIQDRPIALGLQVKADQKGRSES